MSYCPHCGREAIGERVDLTGYCERHGTVFVSFERPAPAERVLDVNEVEIRKGMVVVEDGREVGIVTDVVESDTDYDDSLGRPVTQPPVVRVERYEGGVEEYRAFVDGVYAEDWETDEVEVRP